MLNEYRRDLEYFLKNKLYMVCLIVIAVLAYGFSATNITVGIDDLECDRYIGAENELLAAGRFGWIFWSRIFGLKNRYVENNYIFETAGVICLIWAAINLCILFKRISKGRITEAAYTIFSCTLISYPLMNEIWEYTGVNIAVCGAILFVSFSLLLMKQQLMESFDIRKYSVSALLLMIVCAGYESVAVVYVFMVFTILLLQIIFESDRKETFQSLIKQGMFYAGALAAGVILRVLVHKILLLAMDISPMTNGDTNIWWGKLSIAQIISDILRGIIKEYFVKGIIYFPITELIGCMIIFIIICFILWRRKTNKLYLFMTTGMLLSLILLTLLQGRVSPYRTCQVFAFFVSTVLMLLVFLMTQSNKKGINKISRIVVLLCGVLCIHQASTMNYYFTMNYLRSEEEARVICNIGEELNSKYDSNKPVIMTGTYELSDNLKQRVMIDKEDPRWSLFSRVYGIFSDKDIYNGEEFRKLPNTNVSSVINWAMKAFGSQNSMEKLFGYYGFDYTAAPYTVREEAEEFVENNNIPAYPKTGYIYEKEDYIIVNLQ